MYKVLVVDDSADNVSLIKYFLKDHYDLLVASSGKEAWELIKAISFDLILSDYQMENCDGIWLLNQLKLLPKAPPCIILSADLTKDTDFFIRAGAQGFCPKHRMMDTLLKEVRRFID